MPHLLERRFQRAHWLNVNMSHGIPFTLGGSCFFSKFGNKHRLVFLFNGIRHFGLRSTIKITTMLNNDEHTRNKQINYNYKITTLKGEEVLKDRHEINAMTKTIYLVYPFGWCRFDLNMHATSKHGILWDMNSIHIVRFGIVTISVDCIREWNALQWKL